MKFTTTFLFLLISSLIFVAKAQIGGTPFIQNYPPEKYHGYTQNWAAEQDNRGVMYFGNGKGILEYNGKTWRRFYTTKTSTVLSLGKDNEGRIFVGGENEIGYIAPDSTGLTKFYDLTYLVPEKERDFSYIWHVLTNEKGVYFVSPEKVIRIKNKTVKIYHAKSRYFTAFMANNQFFIQDNSLGLLIEKDEQLVLPPGGEKFGDIRGIYPYSKNQVLFATRERGFFLFDFKTPAKPFKTEADKLLNDFQFYKGTMLHDSTYALGTFTNGVILMDKNGKIKNIINDKSGLLGNTIYALYTDKQGGLWCMLGNGLSLIDITSPITKFDKNNGIDGIIQDIEIFNNKLHTAVIGGVFEFTENKFENSNFENSKFNILPNFDEQYFNLTKFQNELLVVGSGGVFSWDGKQKKHIFEYKSEVCAETSKYHENVVFIGGSGLLFALKKENNKWNSFKMYDEGIEDIYYLAEQNKNTVWASTVNNGIIKFTISNDENFSSKITYYDTTKGLPTGMTEIAFLNNEILVGTVKGVLKYDAKNDKFIPAQNYANELINGENHAYVLAFDKNRLWAMKGKTIGYSEEINNKSTWFDYPFRKLNINDVYKIFPVKNACWIGTTDGMFYYDETKPKFKIDSLNALITNVRLGKDTVFYGAYYNENMHVTNIQPQNLISQFEYYHNSFTFDFALASFDDEERNMYKYFLEGYDENWSDFTFESKKEYTNLPEGNYTFKVKGIDVYGNESKIAEFKFSVLPPWYRTYWAYLSYLILFLLIFYVAIRLNSKRLRAANLKLELIVRKRTQELRERNEEIMQQKEEIMAQRDEIEIQRDKVILQNEEILQQNEEIEAQRDEIENQRDLILDQKQEIVDSINYASFIQRAILPPTNIISKIFTDTFVLFKPKDIVSGDFYWFFEKGTKTYVAAVDCTGHGVPGGFMSMLGISLLSEIVSNQTPETASEILDKLRELVIKSLHQKDASSSSKDGMDIALCIYDSTRNELQFAGANNPIYILKKEDKLDEVKADKMPIGIYLLDDKKFTNRILSVEKGDKFFIFSDGFADQFGGEKGKKFKYNKFKELLVETSVYPMTKQKEIIEKAFIDWISDRTLTGFTHEQIDDVLVVGFEI